MTPERNMDSCPQLPGQVAESNDVGGLAVDTALRSRKVDVGNADVALRSAREADPRGLEQFYPVYAPHDHLSDEAALSRIRLCSKGCIPLTEFPAFSEHPYATLVWLWHGHDHNSETA